MRNLPVLFVTAAFVLNTSVSAQPPPNSFWYNGDFNGVGFHANGINTSDSNSQVFDDFNVPDGQIWNLVAVFSDNLLSTVVTGANWEIRTGVGPGTEGTLIASGLNVPAVVTPTGRSGFGFNEFTVEVSGVYLTLPPGHYWLNVTPIGDGTGRSLNTTTSGADCVGTPCGDNGMSWFRPEGPIFSPDDFSMGVIGTIAPEPATWALLTCGLGALLIALRRRRGA